MAENPIVRKVGVEIECVAPYFDGSTERDIMAHAVIDSDGSIDVDSEDATGYEIKTKPLTGEAAESAITSVCASLKEAGAYVNASCGLHVHADAKPLAISSLVRLYERNRLREGESLLYIHSNYVSSRARAWEDEAICMTVLDVIEDGGDMLPCVGPHGEGFMIELRGLSRQNRVVSPSDGSDVIPTERHNEFYTFVIRKNDIGRVRTRMFEAMRFFAVVDPILRSMIPASRRRNNQYCRPFEKMVRSGGAAPSTLREMYRGIVDRYCGINLNALKAHGTIENRYHNATVDADKIIHWARLWARVVEIAISDNAETEADALADVVSQKSRTDMFFALCALPAATEKHLRSRIRAFSGQDADRVKTYITGKKQTPVCAA